MNSIICLGLVSDYQYFQVSRWSHAKTGKINYVYFLPGFFLLIVFMWIFSLITFKVNYKVFAIKSSLKKKLSFFYFWKKNRRINSNVTFFSIDKNKISLSFHFYNF